MASENETVADIVKEMLGPYYKMGRSNARLDHDMMGCMSFLANRIEAAHRREMNQLPCNARDGEGSSLRIGWEGEKEYCVVAKYRQDLQVELDDYDYHRVTGPLPLDIAKHWLDYHKRIRTKSEDPKIFVREVSKWRLFDQIEEGGAS